MNTLEQLKQKLENSNQDKLNLLYQWVKNDHVSCNQFKELIKWLSEYEKEQYRLDSFS